MKKQKFEVAFKDAINFKVKNGIDTLANAVKSTLGPNGKNVIIKKNKERIVTKDGVTVAKNIKFEDEYENLGADIIKESAIRTNELAGDGTTTSTILAQKIIELGLEKINRKFFKTKTIDLVKKIKEDSKVTIRMLKAQSKEISSPEEIINIASIAANDKKIGKMIGNIYTEIGKEGLIIVEDSGRAETSQETIDGVRYKWGYVSPHFITDFKKGRAIIEDAYILISDLDVIYFQNLIPIVDKIAKENGKNLVIIGNKIRGEALLGIIQNKLQERFQFLAMEVPTLGRDVYLEDLALMTGGKYIRNNMNYQLVNLEISDLGKARKIITDKKSTIIVEGKGNKEKIEERIKLLKEKPEENKRELEKFKSKISVIKIGATTESELTEKKYRYEDSIEATKSALEEGILSGGGISLINASNLLNDNSIVKLACYEPFFQLMKNIDKDGRKYLNKIGGKIGYDANKEKIVDLYNEGIIDSLKVMRIALENAVAVSTLFLKTEAIVLNIKEDKNPEYSPLM